MLYIALLRLLYLLGLDRISLDLLILLLTSTIIAGRGAIRDIEAGIGYLVSN